MKRITYKYEHHDAIVEACDEIFSLAFKDEELPDTIEYYSTLSLFSLEMHVQDVTVMFKTDAMKVFLSFELDTGSDELELNNKPKYSSVQLIKTLIDDDGEESTRFNWETENKCWKRTCRIGKLGILENLSDEIDEDLQKLTSWLEEQGAGYRSSTPKLVKQVLKKTNYSERYIEELDRALLLKCMRNGLLLDKITCLSNATADTMPYDLEFVLKKI